MDTNIKGKYYFFVVVSGIISGTIVLSGKLFSDMGLSLFELATLPFLFMIIALGPFVFFKKYRLQKRFIPLLLLFGLVSAFLTLLEFGGILFNIPVVVIVLLLYTQPLWTILINKIFLKEKITRIQIITCILVLLGMVVLINPFSVKVHYSLLGIVIATLGGIGLAGWITVGSIASKKHINPVTSNFYETFFMLIILAIMYPLLRFVFPNPSVTSFSFVWPIKMWIYFVIFALFSQILNHILFLTGAKKVPAVDSGIIMLLEPLSAAILSIIFLKQPLTINIIIGGAIIIFANYLLIKNIDSFYYRPLIL